MKIAIAVGFVLASSICFCWEEDPRIQEHNQLTDMLVQLGDRQAQEKEEKRLSLLIQERAKEVQVEEDTR